MSKIEDLKTLEENLKKDLKNKGENIDLWKQFFDLVSLAKTKENECFSDREAKEYFDGNFSETMVNAMCLSTTIVNVEYKKLLQLLLEAYVSLLIIEIQKDNTALVNSLKPIFDPSMPIYQTGFADLKNCEIQNFPPEDPAWRTSLSIGMKIDAVREEHYSNERIKGWAPATIISIEEDIITLKFEGLDLKSNVKRDSVDIAPLGYHTEDWDWRENIKEGDRVDAFDIQGKWYLSTVMKTKIEEDNSKSLYIAYRVYFPEGGKTDIRGLHHEGWSESYDTWIPACSLKIQRPNTITKIGTVYCRRILDDEFPAPEDSKDILLDSPFKGETIFVVHRSLRNNSSLFLELINGFGKKNGFEILIQKIQREKTVLSLDFINAVILLVSGPHYLYHRAFVKSHLHPLVSELLLYLKNIPEEELKKMKNDKMDISLKKLEYLMCRVYTAKNKGEELIKLKVGISLSLLRSNQLEKRIQAIRIISDTCKTAKYSHDVYFQTSLPTANDNIVIMGLLQASLIIEEIFGKRSHIQLILRSTDILKFFLQNGNITKSDFNVIWNCCENDEQSRVEIFKVISESCQYFPLEIIEILIAELDAKPRDQLRDQDVELICDLGSEKVKTTPEMIKRVIFIMWDVLCGESPGISAKIVETTLTKFCNYISSLKRVPDSIMIEFFIKCSTMLSAGSNSVLALKILRQSLLQLTIDSSGSKEAIHSLLKEREFEKLFFQDWETYMKQIPEKIKANSFNKDTHKQSLKERKEFALFLAAYEKFGLSIENLELLWKILVKESTFPEEQTTFYNIMGEIVKWGYYYDHVASISELAEFFSKVMCSEENNFTSIPLDGILAFESLIMAVNKHLEKIVEMGIIRKRKKYFIGPMAPNYYNNDNKEEEVDFRVKTLPTRIVGESVLWKIVLESKSEIITSKAIEFLNKLYTKLSDEISERVAEISNIFIEKAINKLKIFYDRSIKNNENHTNEIVKLLQLIEEMLDDSEKNGNNGITPLSGLKKGKTLKLQIINHAVDTIMNPTILNKFDLTVHSRITLWHLKMLIAKKIQIAPELLTFSSNTLTDRNNGKLLEYFKIGDGETLKVSKKSDELKPRVELISKEKLLTEKAKQVFIDIFDRFSTDGKMTPKDCASFTSVALSDRFIKPDDYQVQQLFSMYDKEKKGYLSKESFLSFYESSSYDREDTVWNNLKELGYGPDLCIISESKSTVTTSITSHLRLPRYILTNEKEYFEFLMNLMKMGGEIGSETLNLLYHLAPSEDKLNQVLNFFSSETIDFNTLFSPENYCESTYSLILTKAILSDSTSIELQEIQNKMPSEKGLAWKVKFLEHNGPVWILNTLQTLTSSSALVSEGMQIYLKKLNDLLIIHLLGSLEINGKIQQKYLHFSYTYSTQGSGINTGDQSVNGTNNSLYKKSETKRDYEEKIAENYLKNYQELLEKLKGEAGEKLLLSFDIEKYLFCIQEMTKAMMDTSLKITKNTSNLFTSFSLIFQFVLVYKPELYKILSLKGFKELILKGILYKNSGEIRDIFQELIYFLVLNVKIPGAPLKEIPLGDLMNDMMDSHLLLLDSDNGELIELLCAILEKYKPSDYKVPAFNIEEKLKEILDFLATYKSKEVSFNSQPDNILIGLLQISSQLVKTKNSSRDLSNENRNKIIDEIFFNYLFPLRKATEEANEFKCKTQKSRDAAYNLILSLSNYKNECVLYMQKECMIPLVKQIPEVSAWGYTPEQRQKSNSGFVGIRNLGNICYINSMLQQFFMIVPMRYSLLSVDDGKPIAPNEKGIDDNLLHQFQRMFTFLSFSTRKDFDPSHFCFSYKEMDGRPLMTQIQRDASEFLSILFDRIERLLSPSPYKYVLQNIFGGKSCSQVICSECGYVSSTYEPYYTLSVEIKNQHTLYEALNRYISSNQVSDYKCSGCQKRVNVEKRTLLSSLPNVMIVHLQRFSFNFDTLANEKIHSRLEFPTVLNMKPYTEEGQEPLTVLQRESSEVVDEEKDNEDELSLQRRHSEMEEKGSSDRKSSQKEKEVLSDDYYIYKLVGVVIHNGNADSGHYYSFINVEREEKEESKDYLQTEKQRWVEFNDSLVSEFTFSKLEAECYGGTQEDNSVGGTDEYQGLEKIFEGRSKSAYMLIYERKKKGMIPVAIETSEIQKGDQVLSSLECTGTALSRAQNEGVRIIGTDESKNHYLFYPFYQLPSSVPPYLQKEISEDNLKFLYERMIYNREFINFFNELHFNSRVSYECSSSAKFKEEMLPYLSHIGAKFMIDIFSHAKVGEMYFLSHAGEGISKALMWDVNECRVVLQRFISESGKLFGTLVSCPESQIRIITKKCITAAYKAIVAAEEETCPSEELSGSPLSIKFLEYMVSLIGYELSTEWVKFKEFFELLRDVVQSGGRNVLKYCFEKDLIITLLDFFLEKKSPIYSPSVKRYEMGNMSTSPCFAPLIELVTYLTIHADMTVGEKRIVPPTFLGTDHFELSPMALRFIFRDDILEKHLNCGGEAAQISKLLQHLSFENKVYSKMLCKMIVKLINSYDLSKPSLHFSLIPEIIMLKDQYQSHRIEWILGYQFPVFKSGFGLTTVIDIIDDVNNYFTPLGIEHRDDPMLQQMWKLRHRSEKEVAILIKHLLELVVRCELVYNYFKMMPPPSYVFSHYVDWIRPFLKHYSLTSTNTSDELKKKEIIIEEISSLLAELETRVKKENVAPVQFYMIGKTILIREVKELERTDKCCRMTVSEITTEIYHSNPKITHNPALSGKYLIEHFNHFKFNANSKMENSPEVIGTKSQPVAEASKDQNQQKKVEVEESKMEEKAGEASIVESIAVP